MNKSLLRSLDPVLPDSSSSCPEIDLKALPHSVAILPPSITSLSGCARQEIHKLQEQSSQQLRTDSDQDALDDGFFLCDLSVVRRKLQRWHELFPRIKPFFAIKCNPNEMVAHVLGQQCSYAGFDCASLSEIRLALQCTRNTPRRIIYANPQRAERDLEVALKLGVTALTFDNAAELHKVHRAYQKLLESHPLITQPELILRIVVPDASSTVPLGEKFGAPLQKVESLTRQAMSLEFTIVGISFHCGSGNHDPNAYAQAIRLAKDAMDTVNRIQSGNSCCLLDIGGGYPGWDGGSGDVGRFVGTASTLEDANEQQGDTTANIAAVVTPLVDELFPKDGTVHIISEPGRYFVEAAFALCSRIYSIRVEERDQGEEWIHYYIAQGVHGVFKDVILCGEEFAPMPLVLEESLEVEGPLVASWVHGPSGEDYDVVCKDTLLPRLNVGDWLLFDRMGAYTISIAARSASQPIRYVMGGMTS